VILDGIFYPAVTNIGVKPTVTSEVPLAETHILGYQGDLYEKTVTVTLHRFVRGERRFASVDALFTQVARDCKEAERYFAE